MVFLPNPPKRYIPELMGPNQPARESDTMEVPVRLVYVTAKLRARKQRGETLPAAAQAYLERLG